MIQIARAMKTKTALVFGFTGLTGGEVTKQLLDDDRYSRVRVFVRRPVNPEHPKLDVVVDDLKEVADIAQKIKGDELYCCLGTTRRKAGSKAAFEFVDMELPVRIAKVAHANGVKKFLVISSIGADPASRNFYLRTKGRMEEQVDRFNFSQLSVFRPSLLLGKRNEVRPGEEAGKLLYRIFRFLFAGPLKKYRGIEAKKLACAMIKVANGEPGKRIFLSDEIEALADSCKADGQPV